MSFLFFIVLIIFIVTISNNNKNTQNSNTEYQTNAYSNPTYNQHYSSRSSAPQLKFYSKKDTVELFGYTITNSYFIPVLLNQMCHLQYIQNQLQILERLLQKD